jgi:hypothetical protein
MAIAVVAMFKGFIVLFMPESSPIIPLAEIKLLVDIPPTLPRSLKVFELFGRISSPCIPEMRLSDVFFEKF